MKAYNHQIIILQWLTMRPTKVRNIHRIRSSYNIWQTFKVVISYTGNYKMADLGRSDEKLTANILQRSKCLGTLGRCISMGMAEFWQSWQINCFCTRLSIIRPNIDSDIVKSLKFEYWCHLDMLKFDKFHVETASALLRQVTMSSERLLTLGI